MKKTPEEIADDNARTNEVGLFNYANFYLCCAKHLNTSPSLHLRFDAPIHFLLFHAAELYLKSYLRQKGEDLEAVKRLGHFHPQICRPSATSCSRREMKNGSGGTQSAPAFRWAAAKVASNSASVPAVAT